MSDAAENRDAEYGYRVAGGKALRLQQWRERRDDREFLKLVHRLRALNWQRAVYRENGPRLDALRARKRIWQRGYAVTRRQRRRGAVTTCACGVQWCRLPTAVGKPLKHCSEKCRRANEWQRIRDGKLNAQRKPCRRCGGAKRQGRGVLYCDDCKESA